VALSPPADERYTVIVSVVASLAGVSRVSGTGEIAGDGSIEVLACAADGTSKARNPLAITVPRAINGTATLSPRNR
jgi:hypothetical protein